MLHRNQLGAGGQAGLGHDRSGGDQRLLVGERQPAAGPESRQGDGQTGEPDHTVDHDVGVGGDRGEGVLARLERHARREEVPEFAGERLVGERHDVRPHGVRLFGQRPDRGSGAQGRDPEPVGLRTDDVDRLGPDGAGGAEDGDGGHVPLTLTTRPPAAPSTTEGPLRNLRSRTSAGPTTRPRQPIDQTSKRTVTK
jgi:hypothetical protein